MNTHTASRLTDSDKATMQAAVLDSANRITHDPQALRRVGAHSIGCSLYDLRDSEVAWLDEIVAESIEATA